MHVDRFPRDARSVCLAALLLLVAACGRSGPTSEATEYRPVSFDTGETAELVVVAVNGSVSIRGEDDRSTVDVAAILHASGGSADLARQRVEGLEVSMRQQGRRVDLSFEPPEASSRWQELPSVRFEVSVPTKTSVQVDTSNGEVGVAGIDGEIDLSVSNGVIHVADVSGSLAARGERSDIVVESASVEADLETQIGDIAFSGRLVGPEHRIHASNGGIDLRIPADSEIRIQAEAVTGRIETDLPLSGDMDGREWSAVLNAATTHADLRTVNGWIRIEAWESP